MPTIAAIALDRLIEPGAAKSMVQVRNSPDSKLERRRSTANTIEIRAMDAPSSMVERGYGIPPNPKSERGVNVPPNPKLERGVSVPPRTKLKGGGGVAMPSHAPTTTVVDKEHHWTRISPALYATPESTPLRDSPSSFPPAPYIIYHKRRGPRLMKSFSEYDVATWKNKSDEIKVDKNESRAEKGVCKDDSSIPTEVIYLAMDDDYASRSGTGNAMQMNLTGDEVVGSPVDPQDSVSVEAIGESVGNGGAERSSLSQSAPITEFYDAWEEGGEPVDPAAEICLQLYLTRLVSNSIGWGIAKAEVEMEMEAQIELKNSEIARLLNQEMSHRNQEVVETARRLRQRRQRWIWGLISAALTLGSGVLFTRWKGVVFPNLSTDFGD
ncbi:hypothetical protein SASPL_145180 [Salvia splendens]|uniref:Uncharacterized protein n=1 Tax=Salvia splendens TaxID=180675 RepID=A0A8X8WIK5_SALSN|nr:hypothetical protein SASPL_145180 [Salvia splendens]